LAVVLRIGTKLSDEEYDAQVTPAIVRLWSSPDRALRVYLLDNIGLMIDHLPQKIINDKIFPNLVSSRTCSSCCQTMLMSLLGYRLCGCCTSNTRANSKICFDIDNKII